MELVEGIIASILAAGLIALSQRLLRRRKRRRAQAQLASGSPDTGTEIRALEPPHRNLPRRNPHFVGRKRELEELDAALQSNGGAATLTGLSGIGKSSLVLEYAWASVDAFPGGTWWVDASGQPDVALARLSADLVIAGSAPAREICSRLPATASVEERSSAVRMALAATRIRTLLVLDNVTSHGWGQNLPSGEISVVATTTAPEFGIGSLIRLSTMPDKQSVALARRISRSEDDEISVARVVGGLFAGVPLGTVLASRAVAAWNISWSDYASLVQATPDRILNSEDKPEDYPNALGPAIALSLSRCDDRSLRLLRALACFAPSNIPINWAAFAAFGKQLEARDLLPETGRLSALGLVEPTPDERLVDMHPFLQFYLRRDLWERDPCHDVERLACQVVQLWLHKHLSPVNILQIETLRPHVERAIELASQLDVKSYVHLVNRLSTHLRNYGDIQSALTVSANLWAELEKRELTESRVSCEPLVSIGRNLIDLGEFDDAERVLLRAQRACDSAYGPDHPQSVALLAELGWLYYSTDRHEDASATWSRGLSICEEYPEPSSPWEGIFCKNLGAVARLVGNLDRAEEFARRGLEALRVARGDDDPESASARMELGLVLAEKGRNSEAIAELRQAKQILAQTPTPFYRQLAAAIERALAELNHQAE